MNTATIMKCILYIVIFWNGWIIAQASMIKNEYPRARIKSFCWRVIAMTVINLFFLAGLLHITLT